MIECLEWRYIEEDIFMTVLQGQRTKELWAYDGHTWFKVPTREETK